MSVPGNPKTVPLFKYGRSKGASLAIEAYFVGTGAQGSVADPGACAFADFVPPTMNTAEIMVLMMNPATGMSVVPIRMRPAFAGVSRTSLVFTGRYSPSILTHHLRWVTLPNAGLVGWRR